MDRRTIDYSSLTAGQRSQRARLAAQARWARQDPTQGTQPARDAFLAGFEQQVDPTGQLPEPERARRADSARREHMQRLAFQRSRATK